MDSFLSGFSNNYDGTQIGQGYTGSVSSAGNAGVSSSQSVDVTQLVPGDTFQGEIASVNGEDVQIQLANGQYMVAKLERDVQVAIGQVLNLQVQSNKDNRVVLKPVYDGRMQMLRVGEMALRAAHMAVNDKNLALVSKLIENGMSIDKNTLMLLNRLTLQNPNAGIAELIRLTKLQLPVNDNNITQLQNYQNMEHRLLDGIKEASEEILKLYEVLTGKSGGNENSFVNNALPDAAQGGAVSGNAALENGGKFMEQVLVLLVGKEGQNGKTQETLDSNNNTVSQNIQSNGVLQADGETLQGKNIGNQTENEVTVKNNTQEQVSPENQGGKAVSDKDAGQLPKAGESIANELQKDVQTGSKLVDTILNQLKGERNSTLPDKIVSFIREGKLDIKDMKQLLLDSDISRQLSTEQKAVIFRSEPFQSMLKNGLQKQWTLTPQDLTQDGKVEEFYQRLAKESSQLARMMNEAMQAGGQNGNTVQARAMGNINENVEFMNQMNQMFNYVQLPLKLSNSQAHGDLYVYTNKKNLARRDGMLTAFLHLDMDHLGSLDVSISLQAEKNQVTTKFYLDEHSITLVEGHIDELSQRLLKKGYQCKNVVLEKEEDKTVLDHIEEQVAGGSAVLSYQTFDTRA
ncbi:MAG: flagellar hook-length control protein FliK [Lachnospiraceae bacterium]|nr:flagellar hook-length control protein FliK [Lachnospiraceae bacterium]